MIRIFHRSQVLSDPTTQLVRSTLFPVSFDDHDFGALH
jgi:hypothetical protein